MLFTHSLMLHACSLRYSLCQLFHSLVKEFAVRVNQLLAHTIVSCKSLSCNDRVQYFPLLNLKLLSALNLISKQCRELISVIDRLQSRGNQKFLMYYCSNCECCHSSTFKFFWSWQCCKQTCLYSRDIACFYSCRSHLWFLKMSCCFGVIIIFIHTA